MGVRFRDSFSSASVPTNNVLPEIDRDLIQYRRYGTVTAAPPKLFVATLFARSQRAPDA